jgi:hypothetical protein
VGGVSYNGATLNTITILVDGITCLIPVCLILKEIPVTRSLSNACYGNFLMDIPRKSRRQNTNEKRGLKDADMSIETVMRKYEEQLLQIPNVTGVGIGGKRGKEVIIVFVKKKVRESALQPSEIIPKTLERYETDVEEEIRVGKV